MKRTPTEKEKKIILDAVFAPLEAKAPLVSSAWLDALMGTVDRRVKYYKSAYGKKSDFYQAANACLLDLKLVRAEMERASNGELTHGAK